MMIYKAIFLLFFSCMSLLSRGLDEGIEIKKISDEVTNGYNVGTIYYNSYGGAHPHFEMKLPFESLVEIIIKNANEEVIYEINKTVEPGQYDIIWKSGNLEIWKSVNQENQEVESGIFYVSVTSESKQSRISNKFKTELEVTLLK